MKNKFFQDRIDVISLNDVAPAVFSGEDLSRSGVWRETISFERGKNYLVEATSGAGKSSLCSYLFGTRTDYEGVIKFNGTDIRGFDMNTWQLLRREHIAYLPQDLELFGELTALENILLKNDLVRTVPIEEIEEMLRLLGVSERRDFPVGKMSVGQRQRVALIRALCQPFDFLLLDEPVSHLDPANNALAAAMVLDIASRRQAGIITTSVGNHLQLNDPIKIRL